MRRSSTWASRRPDEEDDEGRAGDFSSPRAAADEFRRAGFERVEAATETLDYAGTPETYLAFKQHYDEAWLFELLEGTPHAGAARRGWSVLGSPRCPQKRSRGGRRSCR